MNQQEPLLFTAKPVSGVLTVPFHYLQERRILKKQFTSKNRLGPFIKLDTKH